MWVHRVLMVRTSTLARFCRMTGASSIGRTIPILCRNGIVVLIYRMSISAKKFSHFFFVMSKNVRNFALDLGRRRGRETPSSSAQNGKSESGSPRVGGRSLFLTLISRIMTIEILNGGCGREVNAGIMTSALMQGCTLHGNHPFVSFEVPDWHFFCSLVYHVYCEFSRDYRGLFIAQRVEVDVTLADGRNFHTQVWCDVENKCLRYVSLH